MSRRPFPRTTPPSRLEPVLASVVAAVLAMLWAPRAARFTTDSESYLDVAANLRAGLGLVQQVVDFWRPQLPDPLGMWPPLYPGTLAAFAAFGVPLERAATLVPGLAFVAFAALFHAFALRVTTRPAARIATAITLLSPALGRASGMAWSEWPFLMWIGASCLMLELALGDGRGRHDARRRLWLAVIAGAFAGFACLTRYLGGALVVSAALVLLISSAPRARLAGFLAPALGLPGLWAIWNLRHFGRPFGPALPRAHETMLEVCGQFASAMRWTLLPAPMPPHTLLAVVALAGIAALLVTSLVLGRSRAIAGAFALCFAASLVAARSGASVNPIGERYVLPLIPFVWLAAASTLAWLAARLRAGAALATVLAVVLPCAAGVQTIRELRARPTPALEPRARAALHDELRALLGDGRGPVLSDAAHSVRPATGRAAIEVPEAGFRLRPFLEVDELRWRGRGVREAVFSNASWRGDGDGLALALATARHGAWLAQRIAPGSPSRWTVIDSSAHFVHFALDSAAAN
ncbi:MAG: hypothetical protein HOP12_04620 [Candidatus Eisenbacteria bacterium]|uniref:Glycosyltransferase RgtA/B/C/D-like domain-containing protein n=1 Tax=Eiseniibacteriota bacterium TaxID=2212470 RepID=A0A849SKR5_UNCEI|nr:hypothetical protein [Candidatus Eisenbacteria bacterium]